MHKKLIAAAFGALLSAGAHAGFVAIDDFNSGDQSIVLTAAGSTDTLTNAQRTLSATLNSATPPIGSTASVSFGILDVTNGGGETSVVSVGWNLTPDIVPAGASNLQFLFTVIESDRNPMSIGFSLNGLQVFSEAIPGGTQNRDVAFGIADDLLNVGGFLELTLTGTVGWDLSLDSIGLNFIDPETPNPTVPEPISLALVGLGLAGIAGVRRCKA